jgi:succinate-acetate transporter protein
MQLANPAPLGLAGFALTTWMLSMVNAGWFGSDAMPLVLALAFAYGGTAQFFAGLMEFPRGNSFGFVAFCSYGAFWWSFALYIEFFAGKVPPTFVGWYLFMWGVFTFYTAS